jgi:hypothetical protein
MLYLLNSAKSESGSRRAKMTHKNKIQSDEISYFELQDVLFLGLTLLV